MSVKLNITFTNSKIFAYILLICGIFFDLYYDLQAVVFMWTVPFSVGMIGGKQGLDAIKAVLPEKWKNSSESQQ